MKNVLTLQHLLMVLMKQRNQILQLRKRNKRQFPKKNLQVMKLLLHLKKRIHKSRNNLMRDLKKLMLKLRQEELKRKPLQKLLKMLQQLKLPKQRLQQQRQQELKKKLPQQRQQESERQQDLKKKLPQLKQQESERKQKQQNKPP